MAAVTKDPGEPARWVDEVEWRGNLVDLHRVMGIVKSLYLVLQHNNEAMLRVGVELVTCARTRKCLWWPEVWYSDDEQREAFSTMVTDKFTYVLDYIKGTVERETKGSLKDKLELEMLQRRAETAETVAKAAQNQQRIAELRCREAVEAAEEADLRITTLEKNLQLLRSMLRKQEAKDHNAEAAGNAKEAAEGRDIHRAAPVSEGKDGKEGQVGSAKTLASGKENQDCKKKDCGEAGECRECRRLRESLAAAERQASAGRLERERLAREVAEARGRQKEAEERAEASAKEALAKEASAQEAPVKEVLAAPADATQAQASPREVARLRGRIAELEAGWGHLRSERDALQTSLASKVELLAEAQAKAKDAEKCVAEKEAALEELQVAKASSDAARAEAAKGPPASQERQELEQLRAKLRRRNDLVSQLQAEKEKLEEDEMKMLQTLRKLQEQLARISELADAKGCKALVQELLEESKLAETLRGLDCFGRLYEDALRRQEKMRSLEQSRFGAVAGRDLRAQTVSRASTNFTDCSLTKTLSGDSRCSSSATLPGTWVGQSSPTPHGSPQPVLAKTKSSPLGGGMSEMHFQRNASPGPGAHLSIDTPLSPILATPGRASDSECDPGDLRLTRRCHTAAFLPGQLPDVGPLGAGQLAGTDGCTLAATAPSAHGFSTPCGAASGWQGPRLARTASEAEALPRLAAVSLSPDVLGGRALGCSPESGGSAAKRRLRGGALSEHGRHAPRTLEFSPVGDLRETRLRRSALRRNQTCRHIDFHVEGLGKDLAARLASPPSHSAGALRRRAGRADAPRPELEELAGQDNSANIKDVI